MALSWPQDCDNARKRMEYCLRARELLRLIHNGFGKWYRTGIMQVQYDQLPNRLKNKYPYVAQISEAVWKQFLVEDFEVIHRKISEKMGEQKALLNESVTWAIDVGNF